MKRFRIRFDGRHQQVQYCDTFKRGQESTSQNVQRALIVDKLGADTQMHYWTVKHKNNGNPWSVSVEEVK